MPKIDKFTIQRVLDATNIEEVIGKFIELHPKGMGVRYVGLCPFHEDHNPTNFIVYPKKRCYRCFACDAKGDAVKFLMEYQHMSFSDAIRWLGKEKGIDVDDVSVNIDIKPYVPPPPMPTLELRRDLVQKTMNERTYAVNFLTWLWRLPWTDAQRERINSVLWEYCIGGWKDGRVVFWQIDADGKPRAAKLMRYKQDGHRDKIDHPGWIYNQDGVRQLYDLDKFTIDKPGFGIHLLSRYPNAEVQVVESEKTSIFCAIYFGHPEEKIWVATAGKNNLGRNILQPLFDRQRTIALHPDRDGIQDWRDKCKEFGYNNIYVNAFATTAMWKKEDGDNADIADVLERVMREENKKNKNKILIDNGKQTIRNASD